MDHLNVNHQQKNDNSTEMTNVAKSKSVEQQSHTLNAVLCISAESKLGQLVESLKHSQLRIQFILIR
jgi:hypothetical protein